MWRVDPKVTPENGLSEVTLRAMQCALYVQQTVGNYKYTSYSRRPSPLPLILTLGKKEKRKKENKKKKKEKRKKENNKKKKKKEKREHMKKGKETDISLGLL
jgi:hypothetical protein